MIQNQHYPNREIQKDQKVLFIIVALFFLLSTTQALQPTNILIIMGYMHIISLKEYFGRN